MIFYTLEVNQTAGVQFQGSTDLSCQVATELDNSLLYLECYRRGLYIVNPSSSTTLLISGLLVTTFK